MLRGNLGVSTRSAWFDHFMQRDELKRIALKPLKLLDWKVERFHNVGTYNLWIPFTRMPDGNNFRGNNFGHGSRAVDDTKKAKA